METGKQRGDDAFQALADITKKADETNQQTGLITNSIRELVMASQSIASSMSWITPLTLGVLY